MEEAGKSEGDEPDAASRTKYVIELSATRIGMVDKSVVPNAYADLKATELPKGDKSDGIQPKKVGSAIIYLVETRLENAPGPGGICQSCVIDELNIQTGNSLNDLQAFGYMLKRIQYFGADNQAQHIAMLKPESSGFSSGLLKQSGFELCDCRLIYEEDRAEFKLCMPLRSNIAPASESGDSRTESPTIRGRDHTPAEAENDQLVDNTDDNPGRHHIESEYSHADSPASREKDDLATVAENDQPVDDTDDNPGHHHIESEYSHVDSPASREKDNIATVAGNDQAVTNTTHTEGPYSQEICRQWVRRGKCTWAYRKSGCKFLHEMPLGRERQRILGYDGVPEWFVVSEHFPQWIQHVYPSQRWKMTGGRPYRPDKSTAQLSGRHSGQQGNVSSEREERAVVPFPGPNELGNMESSHEVDQRNTTRSDVEAGQSLADTSPGWNAGSITAPESNVPSGGSEMVGATGEGSNLENNNVEQQPRRQRKPSTRRYRVPANSW